MPNNFQRVHVPNTWTPQVGQLMAKYPLENKATQGLILHVFGVAILTNFPRHFVTGSCRDSRQSIGANGTYMDIQSSSPTTLEVRKHVSGPWASVGPQC